LAIDLRISPTTVASLGAGDDIGLERQHDQRQRAVLGQQLAANDLVGFDGLDELVVVGALRQFRREQRRRQLAGRRRLARREQRNQAARAVDELQIGDEIAQFLEIFALEQRLALDHDQHVEFDRREALGFRFVLAVFPGIGAEQLAERVVDLDAIDAEQRADNQSPRERCRTGSAPGPRSARAAPDRRRCCAVGRCSVFSTWTSLSLFFSSMPCPVLTSAQFL
jgi:hypothetical protein